MVQTNPFVVRQLRRTEAHLGIEGGVDFGGGFRESRHRLLGARNEGARVSGASCRLSLRDCTAAHAAE